MSFHQKVFVLVAALSLFIGTQTAFAQFKEIGIGAGVLNYTGDLQKRFTYSEIRPGVNVLYRLNFTDAFSVRLNGMIGGLKGADDPEYDSYSNRRSAKFSLMAYEFAALMEYNFFDYRSGGSFIRVTPYLFGGIALMGYSGESEWQDLNADGTGTETVIRDYSKPIMPVIPFGLGFKYNINPKFDINIEFGARKTFDDLIDNVSGIEDNTSKTYAGGNDNTNDWYFFTGISLSYTFYRIPCPHNFY